MSDPIVVQPTKAVSGSGFVQRQSTDPSVPATTTFQQDLVTAGQRHINVMWERTQQIIAITVTTIVIFVAAFLAIRGGDNVQILAFSFLTTVAIMVLSTYFQRTNHTKTGGVGAEPEYRGR
jgi:hypothetical protein